MSITITLTTIVTIKNDKTLCIDSEIGVGLATQSHRNFLDLV